MIRPQRRIIRQQQQAGSGLPTRLCNHHCAWAAPREHQADDSWRQMGSELLHPLHHSQQRICCSRRGLLVQQPQQLTSSLLLKQGCPGKR